MPVRWILVGWKGKPVYPIMYSSNKNILKEMVTVGFISELDQYSFKLRFPSRRTGMTTLKKMIICFIVFSASGAVDCVLDRIIPVN
jgi:hypothetical protein